MCGEKRGDTDRVDIQQAIFDELCRVRNDLKSIEQRINERIDKLEERTGQIVTDLHIVHSLQRTYTGRLAVIEQMCVDRPLATRIGSATSSVPPPGEDDSGNGKLKK